MSDDFVIWFPRPGGNACSLGAIQNVDKTYELERGVPRAGGFPQDAFFEMSATEPRLVALRDALRNQDGFPLVSEPLRAFIEERRAGTQLEFLPVAILNHRGRVASASYFVINPLHTPEALDAERSGARVDAILPEEFAEVRTLVVKPELVDSDVSILRLARYVGPVLVRRGLADAITAEGFTGVGWTELDDTGD